MRIKQTQTTVLKGFLALLIAFNVFTSFGQTYFFKPAASGSGDGLTWENAKGFSDFPTVAADPAFKKIYLMAGNYTLGATVIINNSAGAYVKGGYASGSKGTDTSGYDPVANATVITSSSGNYYINIKNRYQDKEVALIGLSFTGNWGLGNVILFNSIGGTETYNKLGAQLKDLHMYNIVSSTSEGYIEAKITHPDTRISIQGSLFENNSSSGGNVIGFDGAGLDASGGVQGGSAPYFAVVQNNSFVNNSSNDGPAISMTTGGTDILIQNNWFCNNKASNRGGAIYMESSNRVRIDGNTFTGNTGSSYGSAIYVLEGGGQTPGYLITGNTFYKNLPATVSDLNFPRNCCSGGASVGLTNNVFDKASQTNAINGNFNNPPITPNPNTGNTYSATTDPGSCPIDVNTLPIQWGSVSASITTAGKLIVNWITLSETNNDHFNIEASADGKTFKKIGEEQTKNKDGNASSNTNYTFNINNPINNAVAGIGVIMLAAGILMYGNKRKISMAVLIISVLSTQLIFSACNKSKDKISEIIKNQLFIRIQQVDKNGNSSYSNIVRAVKD